MRKQVFLTSLTVTACLFLSACGVPQDDFDALQSEFDTLQDDVDTLQRNVEQLQTDLNDLNSKISACEMATNLYLSNLEGMLFRAREDIQKLVLGQRVSDGFPSRISSGIAKDQFYNCDFLDLYNYDPSTDPFRD